jgi:formiminotetrahydrofolate cyclodeaminase
MALGNMVASLTIGKKNYTAVEPEMLALKAEAERLQKELLALIQQDAEVFEPLAAAYRLPKDSDAEKAYKAQVMEAALHEACGVPLEIMRNCAQAIVLLETAAAKGNRRAVSDAGAGAAFCKAALISASLNVSINTKAMSDRAYADRLNTTADTLCAEYEERAERIVNNVKKRLRGK